MNPTTGMVRRCIEKGGALRGCSGMVLRCIWGFTAFASLFFSNSVRGEEIVIGMSAAFTGASRGLGIEMYRGSTAYFEHVNQNGGVHGRKIRIQAYDDQYEPIPAIANTIRLIETDKVFLLYGYVGTPTVTRVLPLLKKYSDSSMLLFFPFTGAEPQRQTPYSDFAFNLRASYRQETAGLVDNFVGIGKKKIAVFYQIDAYGRSGWDGVRGALAKHDLKMVGEATYRRGTKFEASMQAQVDILRRLEPDLVISVGSYAPCAAFVRDARESGWKVPIANVSFVGSENMLDLLLKAGKNAGKDYTVHLLNSQVVPSYKRLNLPAVRQYRELMDTIRPKAPANFVDESYVPLSESFVSLEGFLDAKLLVEILRKMGPNPDRKKLKAVVESIDKLDIGIDVPVSFGPNRHQGLDEIYYTTVENGKLVRFLEWDRYK